MFKNEHENISNHLHLKMKKKTFHISKNENENEMIFDLFYFLNRNILYLFISKMKKKITEYSQAKTNLP